MTFNKNNNINTFVLIIIMMIYCREASQVFGSDCSYFRNKPDLTNTSNRYGG